MKKILVPIDGSKASRKAAEQAISIAKQFGSEVKLVTVVNLPSEEKYAFFGVNVQNAFYANRKEMLKELITQESKMLKSIINTLDYADIKLDKIVLEGVAYEQILNLSKEENFDLIVMGRRGFSHIERFFIGSVTQRVISDAHCPVLVVNE
ncbi:nucleotide-binding universal stress UspA family protein [Sedimentibacter acidaminivorans]|uniref:Universal stress protein n=1 Tax=Sedimentibacter acidaminivorans TaxID=913099 RepID=A0ABS4GFW7_9FIRM|nr:universal stress protein [Sedimentibacter acidaminivorans]MBP1926590.1 nucleotide-binding universal stress UspA family protein [Sedimentibacter acidaminivorans]